MILHRVVAKAACIPTVTCGTLKLHVALVMNTTEGAVLFSVDIVVDRAIDKLHCERRVWGYPISRY